MSPNIRPDSITWPPPRIVRVRPFSDGRFGLFEAFDDRPDRWFSLGACETAFEANNFAMERHVVASNHRRCFGMDGPCCVELWEASDAKAP